MSGLERFTTRPPKPLPVFILADVSGSMHGSKIDTLNQAMADMINSFGEQEDARAEIHVCVIAFGGQGARLHTPLCPAREIGWADVGANGGTPMGAALTKVGELLEDRSTVPSRAYRPVIVLVSDGVPTDQWEDPLQRTLEGRAAKAERMAMAIGAGADEAMLQRFLADPERRVFRADEARQIKDFFSFVTMTVVARSRSANPNQLITPADPFALEDF